ncbi:hypothetical protein B5807_06023 [Epicoccum nigrum]|uniref:Restriction of telomere capping protein 4 n=1 Tax=Epicoccum nigrum TaxID=105696 RepID=A0A1Y2M3F9_EPING|nr:hypothetical protein B5807_06023 [Epicoccum nigrum]
MAVYNGPRRVGLTIQAPSLLRTVNGKPHAGREDHEEVQQQAQQDAEDVNAEPADSDHDMNVPKASRPRPPLQLKSSEEATILKLPPGPNRKRKAASPPIRPERGLRVPGQKTIVAPRVPKKGQYEQSRAAKQLGRDKENADAERTPPASSASAGPFDFGLSSQTSQKGRKITFGKAKTKNIHVAAPDPRAQKGKRGTISKSKNGQTSRDDESDSSNVSLMSPVLTDEQRPQLKHGVNTSRPQSDYEPEPAPADPELRSVPSRRPRKPRHINGSASDSAPLTDAELDTLLKPTLREQLGLPDNQDSSLPPSSAPQEELDNVDSYVRLLPAEMEEGTSCPLCHEPLDQDTYWAFWKGRDKTVKNQAAFCHAHRTATARRDYAAEGYPPIDWPRLPERIKTHRMALYKILTGETPSPFRTRYAPLALTGKAAAVPSRRTDLPASKRAELESQALDDAAVYPGYYGARGRRLITERVMALLHAEIKRSTDAVVQTSGPATFVQAVMVPEVAVRLIMEDLECDREQAEEVRERTLEMGVLLHEEVEDEVLVGKDEEEEDRENEYCL